MCLMSYTKCDDTNVEGYKVMNAVAGSIRLPVYDKKAKRLEPDTEILLKPSTLRKLTRMNPPSSPLLLDFATRYHRGRYCFYENINDAKQFAYCRPYFVVYHAFAEKVDYFGKQNPSDIGVTYLAPELKLTKVIGE